MKLTFNQKLIGLILIHLVLMIYAMASSWSWWWLFFTWQAAKIFNLFGHDIALHRLWSHQSFKTTKTKEFILHLVALPLLYGSSLTYVGVHREHHQYADTDKDPHLKTWWEKLFYIRDPNYKMNLHLVKDLIRDPWHRFFHTHYIKINLGLLITFLVLFGPVFTGWTISFMAVYLWIGGFCINFFGHIPGLGYRNFDSPDNTTNSYFLQLIIPGTGLHNNHHTHSQEWNFAMKPGEVDFGAFVLKHTLMTKEDRIAKGV